MHGCTEAAAKLDYARPDLLRAVSESARLRLTGDPSPLSLGCQPALQLTHHLDQPGRLQP